MTESAINQLKPAIIVIFGITGDLSQRYLLPSLYHLFKDELLHDQTRIIGITRGDTSTEQLFEKVELCVNEVDKICDPVALKAMHDHTFMYTMDLDDSQAYQAFLEKLNEIEAEAGMCMDRLYYLAIPPKAYRPVVKLMGENGLNGSCQHGQAATRLLVEKPFGSDLASAEELIAETAQQFDEHQIFRIDHYMAKAGVQTLLKRRLEDDELGLIWNKDYIASIEISAKEQIGIEGRATFYEPLGALRDFIQSHLVQILGLVVMDKPTSTDSQHIHAVKEAALAQVQPVSNPGQQAVRGQYEGYRQEVNNPHSMTETYAAVTVYAGNEHWQGVPITLLTGKALDERRAEVRLKFKPDVQREDLVFAINGPNAPVAHPEAYEKVLLDAIAGDQTVFASDQEVLIGWRVLQPVLDAWQGHETGLATYPVGSAGPLSAKL